MAHVWWRGSGYVVCHMEGRQGRLGDRVVQDPTDMWRMKQLIRQSAAQTIH